MAKIITHKVDEYYEDEQQPEFISHLYYPNGGYHTLCGQDTEDDGLFEEGIISQGKVTCPFCIDLINGVKQNKLRKGKDY